jgi:hypothetical protein
MKPKLECTRDYGLFRINELNRALHESPTLLKSMSEHGFMPSSPIHCVRKKDGTLSVIRGHHRLHYAMRLKLPVYFVVDASNDDLFELEGGTRQAWNGEDFAVARAKGGDNGCAELLKFKEKHKLPLQAAAALMGGEGAQSHNKIKNIKAGTFEVGDINHALEVVRITDLCLELKMPFATCSAFVSAISMSLRIKAFDSNVFCKKLKRNYADLKKRGCLVEYLLEIEDFYNHGFADGKKIPLKLLAIEEGNRRRIAFGRGSGRVRKSGRRC